MSWYPHRDEVRRLTQNHQGVRKSQRYLVTDGPCVFVVFTVPRLVFVFHREFRIRVLTGGQWGRYEVTCFIQWVGLGFSCPPLYVRRIRVPSIHDFQCVVGRPNSLLVEFRGLGRVLTIERVVHRIVHLWKVTTEGRNVKNSDLNLNGFVTHGILTKQEPYVTIHMTRIMDTSSRSFLGETAHSMFLFWGVIQQSYWLLLMTLIKKVKLSQNHNKIGFHHKWIPEFLRG